MDDDAGRVLAFPQAPDAIELRHLRAFVAVAEELNFGRAAERLYLSQPALSRQIRALERLVGCDLLRRSTHQVALTLAGEALLDRARRLLRDVDEAVSATQSVGGELATRVARMWAPLADVASADADLQDMRAKYEELHAGFSPPPEVAVQSVNAGGVPGFTVTPPGAEAAELLYLHGGGYIMGSAYGFRHLAGALAMAAGTGALVPEYRLAPEHPLPCGARGRAARLRVDARPRRGAGSDRRRRRLGGRRSRALAAAEPRGRGAADAGRSGALLPVGRPLRLDAAEPAPTTRRPSRSPSWPPAPPPRTWPATRSTTRSSARLRRT